MTIIQPEKLLFEMLRIRLIEEAIADRYSSQKIRCPIHLCIGQEAIAVGVCDVLELDDKVYSNHRAHGHYLAKGGDLNSFIAELYGRSTGCSGGRGGSMHLIDLNVGFMGSTPIVGGTVPIAVGTAWASTLQKKNIVTVVFFGDGCFEEGVIHEAFNFSVVHNLPVLFVCENNNYSVYTPLHLRQPLRPIHIIARSHGISAYSANGNNIEEVRNLALKTVVAARSGHGPQFIEFKTFRWREHCGPNFDNELNYRSQDEFINGLENCPIQQYILHLEHIGFDLKKIFTDFEIKINDEIKKI